MKVSNYQLNQSFQNGVQRYGQIINFWVYLQAKNIN